MKNDIIVPDHFPDLKEEDLKTADLRRERYSQGRDLLAKDFNEAIAKRLLATDRNQVKCEKCGKEFTISIIQKDTVICSECKSITRI